MNDLEQLIQKYTFPEQYVIYLSDIELIEYLKGVISQENPEYAHKDNKINEERVNLLSQLITEQFGYTFDASLRYIRETVYREAAKRWLKRTVI